MNHTAVTNNLTQYVPEMELMHSYDPNITFLLGETNSDYVNLNMIQVEGVFGSSIWLVDYLLYGMSLVSLSTHPRDFKLTYFDRTSAGLISSKALPLDTQHGCRWSMTDRRRMFDHLYTARSSQQM